ncbi:hypothetical protein OHA98_25505 [Streptomyces sp. NBC_00654]|uniref:hypothetical protein n=1 Tax=Streptomyces sp. NBC_00654 TaxID=2975799 RepID=UPI002254AFD4|nr:hypothetical protein [Streptomyces sp. NBC_00654]MCX4968055.1 hypothetical protein [Streptomyces sp. NBC_00654]
MAQSLALGQLRVEKVRHRNGRCSYTVFDSASGLHPGADWYLSKYAGTGSDRTYAYLLVDHLRWLEHEGLTPESVVFRDLKRYMGAVGAKIPMPYGPRGGWVSAPTRTTLCAGRPPV